MSILGIGIGIWRSVNRLGKNLITNGEDWLKTTGLYDILSFADYASTIDGATRVNPFGAVLNVSNCENATAPYDYTSFGSATPTGFNATSDGSASQAAGTADELTILSGKKYVVEFDLGLNSGTAPFFNLT